MGRQPPILPEELQPEILSCLPVKSLLRFRCVSKSWNSIISDSQFIKLHLHRSSCTRNNDANFESNHFRLLLSETSPLESPSAIAAFVFGMYRYSGTCNGLVCLRKFEMDHEKLEFFSEVRLWNPATRSISQHSPRLYTSDGNFGFGYDYSSDTYKVVALIHSRSWVTEATVNVYSMGDANACWRRIHVFPLPAAGMRHKGDAVYVSNTLNWLAIIKGYDDPSYIILSFDLAKENFAQLSLPCCNLTRLRGFVPVLGAFRGCLCIFQIDKKMNFGVWQMKEFGVHKSWTLLFNANIIPSSMGLWTCFTMYMSEYGDALLLAKSEMLQSHAILYTKEDNILLATELGHTIFDCYPNNYIESLVSPCWK